MSVGAIAVAVKMVECALGLLAGILAGNATVRLVAKIRSPQRRLIVYLSIFFACIFALALATNSH